MYLYPVQALLEVTIFGINGGMRQRKMLIITKCYGLELGCISQLVYRRLSLVWDVGFWSFRRRTEVTFADFAVLVKLNDVVVGL